MLFKNLIGGQMSGSVGAIVASHNSGGAYFRLRATPTNPNTPQQVLVRNAFALLAAQWTNVLTASQRDAWELYAANVSVVNRIGEQINISGLAMYTRCNTARRAQGIPSVLDGPTTFTNSAFLQSVPSNATAAAQTIDIPFSVNPLTAPWALEAGSFLLVYISRPQNLTVNFFNGPFRFAGAQEGNPIPPVSPFVANVPFTFVAGQKLFVRQVVVQIDGRISGKFISQTITVA